MHGWLRDMIRPLVFAITLTALCTLQPAGAGQWRFTDVERVVAIGDIHGALDELVAVLQGTGLVDEELRWSGGNAHLVSLGDLLDRGDLGRQVMDLLMRLQEEAAEAGGAVHVVLGNHEVMNLVGDLRYVSPGDYAQFGGEARDGLPAGFLERRMALAPGGDYGQWLLGRPVAVAIDDTLFMHGGVSSLLDGLSLEKINEVARHDVRRFAEGWDSLIEAGMLTEADEFDAILALAGTLASGPADAPLRQAGVAIVEAYEGLPFVRDGPLWYRGNARCHPYTETAAAERILTQLEVRRVAVGHTPTPTRRITSRLDGRVIMVDTGMNVAAYRGQPAALVIEDGQARAWYVGKGPAELQLEENRIWARPGGLTDMQIEDFLRTADVTRSEEASAGKTTRRLTLEKGGLQLEAVFNTVNTAPGLPGGRWTRAAARAERYQHDIAAYRLDRLIDLHMVPVTVERRIGEDTGALRILIDGVSEAERQAGNIGFAGSCPLAAQYELMGLFDALIFNRNPALGELRYDGLWQLWLMDQSKAFGPGEVSAALRRAGLVVTPQMADALARITPESVASLAEYLHRRQLDALLGRVQELKAQR